MLSSVTNTRYFSSFTEFMRFTQSLVPTAVAAELTLPEVAANILYVEAQQVYGDNQQLAHLAVTTQRERMALGYSADDPLVRDGSLLRASMEKEHGPRFAAIGSSEPIAAYHEFGYVNARTGEPVPPRPVYQIALREAEISIKELVMGAIGVMLGFRPIRAFATTFATRTGGRVTFSASTTRASTTDL